jgi:hypothetical protein
MKIFDKLFLTIYWVVNKKLNPQKTTIWTLNYLIFPPLSGLLAFVFSLIFWMISFHFDIKLLVIICVILSFFFSDKLINKYYTEDTQKMIIEKNKKPGFYRYLIFIFILFLSILLMLFLFLLAGIFLNK